MRTTFYTYVTLMGVLMFSMPALSFAEQHYTTEDAIADAMRDAERDISRVLWFSSGVCLTCVGASSFVAFEGQLGLIGAVLLPIGGLGLIHSRPSSPPAERLIGKPPEYVSPIPMLIYQKPDRVGRHRQHWGVLLVTGRW